MSPAGWLRRPAVALALIALVAVVPRWLALPRVGPDTITPDGARFLNLARSIARGDGYVTPEAWPAYLAPARLPMPETFKEPGYPYAIAAVAPLAGDPLRAGQWISLLAGLLLPFVVYALARVLVPEDSLVAAIAGLLTAGSPVQVVQSVVVMAESLSTLALMLAFLAALARPRGATAERGWALDLATGALCGLAYLVRAQALVAVPALAWALARGRPARVVAPRLAGAALAMAVVMAPWMVRNLRLFGVPLYSDVAAFAVWPYVDTFAFSHSLVRPPAPLPFALAHLGAVAHHTLGSLRQFTLHTLPDELLGSRIWLIPLALGLVRALGRWRAWGPLLLLAALSAAFLFPLNWVARYFAPVAPVFALVTAFGMAWLSGTASPGAPASARARRGSPELVALVTLVLVVLPLPATIRAVADSYHPELAAARAHGPWLARHLAPGEAVMADMTSYWAWCSGRPAVHPPVTDETRFVAAMRRLRVRYAALPTSRLAEFAARYPARRLPAALVPFATDSTHDVTLFDVRTE